MTHERPTPYPDAERADLIETLHGHQVSDPYRWLEDPTDPRTIEWSTAQDELTRSQLDALPGRDAVSERLRGLMSAGSVAPPTWRAGRAFFTRREPGQEFPVLHVRESDGSERVLLDVAKHDPTGRTTLDAWSPSPSGRLLAYQVSVGGDEESLLHVMDVRTGEVLDGPIDRCRYSSIGWLPDEQHFYYVRRLKSVPAGEESFHRRVWLHRIGADADSDTLVHGDDLDSTFSYGVAVSRDGRWLTVHGCPGTARRDSVWIADLTDPEPTLRQIIDTSVGARVLAWVERDGRLYIQTTLNAPRWRLCVADPAHPEPDQWTELISEDSGSVLEAVRWFDNGDGAPRLAVLRTRHAVSELSLHDPATGALERSVPLPGTGQVFSLTTVDEDTEHDRDQLWIGWTDFTTPPCVYRFAGSSEQTVLAESAPGATDSSDIRTRQVSYTSRDGTTVRMFVLSSTEAPDDPRPALLTGYGGFSLSMEPAYTPSALAWVRSDGVWALPSLRGGSEEGEQWHHAGMRANKQNVFDDFHAAAEYLIAEGWTTPDQLAITGGSNGGLLVGAALTQRPGLYRAAVCSAPLLDMVRYERFLLGRAWREEYGSADDAEEIGWLLAYSPYHNVAEGTEYPSVLFTVFESDSRVDPNHARKMCAALQHASGADFEKRPVLLRRETQVGHAGRAVSRMVALTTDQLAFLAAATGLCLV